MGTCFCKLEEGGVCATSTSILNGPPSVCMAYIPRHVNWIQFHNRNMKKAKRGEK